MDKNKFTVRYIPLEPFLHLMEDLLRQGVEFIDLEGWIDPEKRQDIIKVCISKEEDEPEELKEIPIPKGKMTEDDINELM